MVFLFLLLFLVGICLVVLLPAIWGEEVYHEYRDQRTVNCPETHEPVAVRFNAVDAALGSLSGRRKLRLADCTRWPEKAGCDQACIPDARNATEPPPQHVPWHTRRVVHGPVLVAAATAWVLGMVWHSQYVFRPQWAAGLGLDNPQALALARMLSPHLLSVGVCLLFAYGVANMLRLLGSRTFAHGVEVSGALWLAMFGVLTAVTWSRIAPNILWIEGGYTLLAALLIGAIVGGAPRWIVQSDPEERLATGR